MSIRLQIPILAVFGLSAIAANAAQEDPPENQRRRPGRPAAAHKAPEAGQVAPTVTLNSLDGKQTVELANFKGKRPVIMFFGSYT